MHHPSFLDEARGGSERNGKKWSNSYVNHARVTQKSANRGKSHNNASYLNILSSSFIIC